MTTGMRQGPYLGVPRSSHRMASCVVMWSVSMAPSCVVHRQVPLPRPSHALLTRRWQNRILEPRFCSGTSFFVQIFDPPEARPHTQIKVLFRDVVFFRSLTRRRQDRTPKPRLFARDVVFWAFLTRQRQDRTPKPRFCSGALQL